MVVHRWQRRDTRLIVGLGSTTVRLSHGNAANGDRNDARDGGDDDDRRGGGVVPRYVTRSTADPEPEAPFAAGWKERRARLEEALVARGVDVEALTTSADYDGSAARRAYCSFVLPKSEGALAVAESPRRVAVVANNIAFYVRELESHRTEWLVNHDRCLAELEEHDDPSSSSSSHAPVSIVLDDVRSAHNVGNILRAAEAARVRRVWLTGITPAPPNPAVLKTALGAAEFVPHSRAETATSATEAIRRDAEQNDETVSVWGVETTTRSRPLWDVEWWDVDDDADDDAPDHVVLVFGNEVVGVHADVLKRCDGLVAVPTMGIKNSLNVATCASIVVWEALRQWEQVKRRDADQRPTEPGNEESDA